LADPVSWLMIEPGWKVLAADGSEVGRVEDVTGDSNTDIFNGLSISTGMLSRPRYVPAEQVAGIVEGAVRLALSPQEIERLGDYDEPPTSSKVTPETSSLWNRVVDAPRPVPLGRRIARWLGIGGRR
jgi:Uncharacterized protein conserved in bacteria (DUF2171)